MRVFRTAQSFGAGGAEDDCSPSPQRGYHDDETRSHREPTDRQPGRVDRHDGGKRKDGHHLDVWVNRLLADGVARNHWRRKLLLLKKIKFDAIIINLIDMSWLL